MAYPMEEDNIKKTAELYMQLADGLKDCKARLLIHNGQPDVGVTINGMTAYEYLVECCMGKAGMQFDLGWCAAGGVDPQLLLKRSADKIESLHFKDFKKPGVSDRDIYIGGGSVDSMPFVKFGLEENLPMFVDQDCYEDLIEDVCKSYEYLLKVASHMK